MAATDKCSSLLSKLEFRGKPLLFSTVLNFIAGMTYASGEGSTFVMTTDEGERISVQEHFKRRPEIYASVYRATNDGKTVYWRESWVRSMADSFPGNIATAMMHESPNLAGLSDDAVGSAFYGDTWPAVKRDVGTDAIAQKLAAECF